MDNNNLNENSQKINDKEQETLNNSKNNKKNEGLGCSIALAVVFAIIIAFIALSSLSDAIKSSNETKHRLTLIQEGKIVSSEAVINEIVEILKTRQEDKLKKYLANDFKYYDNNNMEHKNVNSFFEDLQFISSTYDIERRGDTSSNDWATYRVYWNVVEENKSNGINRGEQYYCLQTITIMLKKVVDQDIITYEVEKIILKNP